MLNYQNDPVINHVIKMQQLLPSILQSKELTPREKMQRYTNIVSKLRDLTTAQYQQETDKLLNRATQTEVAEGAVRDITPEPADISIQSVQDEPTQVEQPKFEEYFAPRNRTRAMQIVHALQNNSRVALTSGPDNVEILGKPIKNSSIVDIVQKLVNSSNLLQLPGDFPAGTLRILKELALHSNLGAHSIANRQLKKQFMEFRKEPRVGSSKEMGSQQKWITTPNIRKTKSGRISKPVKRLRLS